MIGVGESDDRYGMWVRGDDRYGMWVRGDDRYGCG